VVSLIVLEPGSADRHCDVLREESSRCQLRLTWSGIETKFDRPATSSKKMQEECNRAGQQDGEPEIYVFWTSLVLQAAQRPNSDGLVLL
jgi:hypothetical protein